MTSAIINLVLWVIANYCFYKCGWHSGQMDGPNKQREHKTCSWSNWSDPIVDRKGAPWQNRKCSVCNRTDWEPC